MYKSKSKIVILITSIILLFIMIKSSYAVQNNINTNINSNTNNIVDNSNINNNTSDNEILSQEESSTSTLAKKAEERNKKIENLKKEYGSDTYGIIAYILSLVQAYSIPLGLVGIAFCAIFQYIIGIKRLDIRDKGFNSMIAIVTIIIICQILPVIFAVVVKSPNQ